MTCKKCNKSDHSRSSSEKCLFYSLPRRKRKLGEDIGNYDERISTIKCALNSICKNDLIYEQIQQDVREMSGLCCEFSIYVNFVLYKNWNNGIFPVEKYNFLQYFYHLMSKKAVKYEIDSDYKIIRLKEFSNYFYNSSKRSNIFIEKANLFETNFHNNLFIHAYKRIRRFLYNFCSDKVVVYQTLDTLFTKNSKYKPNYGLIDVMKNELTYDGLGFFELTNKQKYIKYIKFFYNLQKYNHVNGFRNFKLVPIFRFGCHHIQYDSKSLFELLQRVNLISGKLVDMANDEWYKWFDVKKFENRRKTFGYSIKTDGVSISLSMSEFIKKNNEPISKKTKTDNESLSNAKKLIEIRTNLVNEKYKQFIGLDPGRRLLLGGISKNPENDRNLIKFSSKRFHHFSSKYNREKIQAKWTKQIDSVFKHTIQPLDFIEYTKWNLKHFANKQFIYAQRKITRNRFKTFICREKGAKKVCKEIVGKYKHKTLIILGDTKTPADSVIKGYIRTPNKHIVKQLEQVADILQINEFRTTKLCSKCHEVAVTSKSPHRYQFCQKCGISWNRDVNAGNNMLTVGLFHHLFHQELPHNFKKTTILQ